MNHMKASGKQIDTTMKKISARLNKEDVAANNVGDGNIAGMKGDAGKKVKMMSEPLRRKAMPKFKTYVSQEHDNG